MQNQTPQTEAQHSHHAHNQTPNIERQDHEKFHAEMDRLIRAAEDLRLARMQEHRGRGFLSMTISIISILIGSAGFGWFFLMQANLLIAVLCMLIAIIPPTLLHIWAERPLKAYAQEYKTRLMPQMAQALGGLKFHPSRGISAKIINKTGIIPPYKTYIAEDCFMGRYKGTKLIFSEARLYGKKNKSQPIFDGIFVLLEVENNCIEGHTIITADKNMAAQWQNTRWKKLQNMPVGQEWSNFQIFSDSPKTTEIMINEQFLKELSEAANIFDNAPLSAVLFREKFIFLAIPYENDMFEASNIHVPITTKEHALCCKKEIEQILEIIDVVDLCNPASKVDHHAT